MCFKYLYVRTAEFFNAQLYLQHIYNSIYLSISISIIVSNDVNVLIFFSSSRVQIHSNYGKVFASNVCELYQIFVQSYEA